MPSAIGSQAATSRAPASWATSASALEVLDGAEVVRVAGRRRRRSARRRRRRARPASVRPSVEPDLDDLGRVAARSRCASVSRLCGWSRAETTKRRPLGRADRQVAGGGDGRGALVEAGARERQAGQLRHRGLELEHRLQAALGDLRLVGRVGGEELRARGDRVDDRRHVVVVHPGAEEADLRLGVGVAGGELAHALVDLGLVEAVGEVERAGRGGRPRGRRRRARRPRRRRSPRASRRGRRRLRTCSGSSDSDAREARSATGGSALSRASSSRVGGERRAAASSSPGVAELDLDHPALAVGIVVDQLRVLAGRVVDGR